MSGADLVGRKPLVHSSDDKMVSAIRDRRKDRRISRLWAEGKVI